MVPPDSSYFCAESV